jgi:hypothetical protein
LSTSTRKTMELGSVMIDSETSTNHFLTTKITKATKGSDISN